MSKASATKSGLFGVRWQLILLAGAGAQVLTLIVITLVISLYAGILAATTGRAPDTSRMESFSVWVGTWGSLMLPLLLTAVTAAWAARKAGVLAVRHGFLVSAASALCGLAIGIAFRGTPGALATVFVLTVIAGCLGGLQARSALTRQRAFYEASRSIGVARSPQDIVEAIGEHLADARVERVALWQSVRNVGPAEYSLRAVWEARKSRRWPPNQRLSAVETPTLTSLDHEVPVILRPESLPAAERGVWEDLGVRRALLLPLPSPDGVVTEVLMVASSKPRAFFRGVPGSYSNIRAQVALALENQRLVEQGREMGVMAERGRLAREIHDTLAQGFISIVTQLEVAEEELPPGSKPAQRHLDQARSTARENLAEARRLVAALRPEILEGSSLPEALERLTSRWSEASGVSASLAVTGDCERLPQELQVALLRVAQEALSNVRKHSGAGEVTMTLSYLEDLVVLDVQDDGCGFVPGTTANGSEAGFGLKAMRERVEQLGGRLLVESEPGEGTTLAVQLPVATADAEAQVAGERP